MADYDTTHLLALLRQHTSLPAVQGWDDTNSLRLLTSVLHGYILPLVKVEWQEHYLSNEATTWTTALVENRREYALPSRATAASVRKAVLVGPNGARRPLRLFEVDQQEEWNTARTDLPEGYVLRGGRIYLHPAPSGVAAANWRLRAQLVLRPARLVLLSATDKIDDAPVVVGSNTVYALASNNVYPTNGTTTVDVVRGTPPFEALMVEATAIFDDDNNTVSFPTSSLPPEGLGLNDYVCPVGTSPFAQMPVELLEVLAARAAVEQLGTIGDTVVAEAKAATLGEQRKDATTLVTPRTGEARLQGNGMRKFRGTPLGWGWPRY